jgi:hypothetical protein
MVGEDKQDETGQADRVEEQHLVVLFGDSLFMDAVEASLEDCAGLGVIRIHATVADIAERLASLCPDLVILDMSAPQAQFILPFLQDQPDVPLLCLDVTRSKVLALSRQQYPTRTARELLDVIQRHVPATVPAEARPDQTLDGGS